MVMCFNVPVTLFKHLKYMQVELILTMKLKNIIINHVGKGFKKSYQHIFFVFFFKISYYGLSKHIEYCINSDHQYMHYSL